MSDAAGASDQEGARSPHSDDAIIGKRLYQDVLTLFSIQDGEGALVSLERLLNIGYLDEEIEDFLALNSAKLVELYESILGPFTKVVSSGSVGVDEMPTGYLDRGLMRRMYEQVDGVKSIAELISDCTSDQLRACAALEQLHRARLVVF